MSFRRRTDNLDIGEEFARFYEVEEYAFEVLLHAPPLPGASLGSTRTVRLPMKPLEEGSRFEVGYDRTEVPGLYRLDFNRDVRSSTGAGAGSDSTGSASREPTTDARPEAETIGSTVEYFAVNVRTAESDLSPISIEDFTTHFGFEPQVLDFSVRLKDIAAEKERLRGRELWRWCVLLVLILLFAETILAQRFGRRAG